MAEGRELLVPRHPELDEGPGSAAVRTIDQLIVHPLLHAESSSACRRGCSY